MLLLSELQEAAKHLVDDPRVNGAVPTATMFSGFVSMTNEFGGVVSITVSIIGAIATLLLARLNWIKYKNEMIRNRILVEQAAGMGIDVLKIEDEE